MVTVLVDTAWSIYVKGTIQRAVRVGVRSGVVQTSFDLGSGNCLTPHVKSVVQQNSLGILKGDAGLAKIKVNYFRPPLPNSNDPAVDVSDQPGGNQGGNIMQVSVQNFSLIPLMPRIFRNSAVDNNPLVFSAVSSDLIEPTRYPPCIGTAP
jgi:hypothetical protein